VASIPLGSTRYYRVRVHAWDAVTTNWSTPRSFRVEWIPALTGRAPGSGAVVYDRSPYLRWDAVSGAVSYEMQVDSTEAGLTDASPIISWASSAYTCSAFAFGETKFWRVRPVNAEGGKGAWSPAWSFAVSDTHTITALAVDTADTTPLLRWNIDIYPTGVTYDVQIANDGGFSPSTITTAAIPAGSPRYWRVRAKNDNGDVGVWSSPNNFVIDWNYTIAAAYPSTATTLDQTPLLDWNDVTGASSWEVAIADSSIALNAAKNFPLSAASSQHHISTPIVFTNTQWWAVRPVNSEGFKGAWSGSFSFQVTNAYTFSPVRPLDGAEPATNPPCVEWNAVPGAVSYDFQIATPSAGVSGASVVSCPSYIYYTGVPIPAGSYRYWRVAGKNADGNTTAYSSIFSFYITWTYADPTISPLDNAPNTGGDLTSTLSWSAVSGASSYELQLKLGSKPTDADGHAACASNSYTTPLLADSGLYFWRIRPINSEGFAGPWSTGGRFTAK
jgi:hypothetical protein